MTTIGSSTLVVTLSPGAPKVTLNGTINAYGPAGTIDGFVPIEGAVYGPASAHFTIQNTGTIISDGTSHLDFGIALLASGSITNTGDIGAANAIGILNTTGTSYIDNSGVITGTKGDGIDLFGAAYVTNAKGGRITGSDNGITGYSAGAYVYNYASINGGGEGIALSGGAVYNSGTVTGGTFGVNAATGSVYNYKGGVVTGGAFGVSVADGVVHNDKGAAIATAPGLGSAVGVTLGSGSVYNAGSITGGTGIKAGAAGDAAYVYNYGSIGGLGEGVALASGAVYNAGRVSGGTVGVSIATGAVYNYTGGLIVATSGSTIGTGITLGAGSAYNAGTVSGYTGIEAGSVGAGGAAIFISNDGIVSGNASGILLNQAGTIDNRGEITGFTGVYLKAGTLGNSGTVTGFGMSGVGVRGASGTDVVNTKAGVLSGGEVGALLVAASLNNAGYIGGSYGVVSEVNGTVNNSGSIFGGVRIEAGGTLIDTGFIEGATFAVAFIDGSDKPGTNDRLVIDAAATLKGDVYLSSGALEIEADGSKIATLSAAQLGGIGTLSLDSKAILDIAGTYKLAGTVAVTNAGTIHEGTGDALTIGGPVSGTGVIALGAKTTLSLNNAVGANQVIDFTGTAETLELGTPGSFAAKIETFAVGDTIALAGISLASVKTLALSGGVLTIATTMGTDHITFASPASFKGETFASFADGGGIGITLSAAAKMAFVPPETAGLPASPTALPDARAAYAKPAPGSVPMATAAQHGWLMSELVRPPAMTMPVTLQS